MHGTLSENDLQSFPFVASISSTSSPRNIDKRHLTAYDNVVIASFKHRGLKKLYEDDDRRGISAAHLGKIKRILARLDEAAEVRDMAPRALGFIPQGRPQRVLGRICLRKLAHRLSF